MTERSKTKMTLSRRDALRLMAVGGAAGLVAPDFLSRPAFAESKPPAKPTGQIIVGVSQEPTVFNPLMAHNDVDDTVHFAVFDALFRVDPQGVIQPNLAAELPTQKNGGISKDGLNWRVRLRDGVHWHDGKAFTADDVKYTLELIVNPKFRAWSTNGFALVKNIKVVSPTEITWQMEKAFAPFLAFLTAAFIVPKHIMEKEADLNRGVLSEAPIGTGAFKWSKRVPGDHIELAANTGYFGDGPHVEQLIFKYIPDQTVLYTQFKSGSVAFVDQNYITADHYAEARSLPGKVATLAQDSSIESIYLNLGLPQFKELAVRQALYAAMDRKSIIDTIYYGVDTQTETYMPSKSYYYNPKLPVQQYNLDRAREILDEAGWRPGPDGIRTKNGLRLSFTNSTTSGNNLREQTQQFLQQTFAQIGVEMKISNLPGAVMWGDFWQKSKFETAMVGVTYMIAGDPDVTNRFATSAIAAQGGSGSNTAQYSNSEVDALLRKGALTFDPEARRTIYFRIQELIRHDLPFLPMFEYSNVLCRDAKLKGFVPNAFTRTESWHTAAWYWES